MAVIQTNLRCELNEAVKVQYLDGVLFSQDNQANQINVAVYENGEPASIAGDVTANVIRSDGGTVAVSGGTISENVASISLPSAAYYIPGVISIIIKITDDSVITTIATIVANVYRSSTDTAVDPGTIIPSIQTLITSIETAVASIPADYSSLWTTLAPAFSTDVNYAEGQYVTYNGAVYRFKKPHSGSWSSSDAAEVNIGGELNSLKNAIKETQVSGINKIAGGKNNVFYPGYYTTPASGTSVSYNTARDYVCTKVPVSSGDKIIINATGYSGNSRLYVFIDSSGKALNRCSTGLSGERIVTAPAGAVYLAVNNLITSQASGYYCISGDWERSLFDMTQIEQGTYNSTTGEVAYSTSYCRTPLIKITDIAEFITPSSNGGFIYKYNSSKEYIERISNTTERDFTGDRIISEYGGSTVVYIAFVIALSETTTTPEDVISAGFRVKGIKQDILAQRINSLEYSRDNELVKKSQAMYRFTDFEQGSLDTSGQNGNSYIYCRTHEYISIGTIDYISVPENMNMIICSYDASKTFIERKSYSASTTHTNAQILKDFGHGGECAYLRLSVKRTDNGEDIESLPSDIVASELDIEVVGASEDVYEQIIEIKGKLNDEGDGQIPLYYDSYIADKINTINTLEDSVSVESDSLIFITDYHYQKNAQHSPQLISKIIAETGITKLFFGGDAGGSAPLATMYRAARNNGKIYQKLWDTAPQFYGMLGNHEWNDTQNATHEASQQEEVYGRAGVVNFYINRQEQIVKSMSSEGNYYIDNVRSKIRYFVLQVTGQAKITNETAKWLGDQLGEVPNGWYVVVLCHYAYTGGVLNNTSLTGRGNQSVIRISQLLGALKNGTTVTINQYANTGETTGNYSFDYTSKSVTPVCILSGHTHWDASLSTSESDYGILTIATTTDAFGYAKNASTGSAEPRQVGTTAEQAFDVVQIDLDAQKVYMTRIGGGSDREFSF